MMQQIQAAVDFIRDQYSTVPQFGIILGTGLGSLAQEVDQKHTINYENIPHFPVSTVESHSGRLIFGTLGNTEIVVMQGRFHYYEGYSMQEVTFPVRVLKMLGISKLFISNAAGSLNPDYRLSDLMVINDHINLQPGNPLRGPNLDELGPRFPDMSEAYDQIMVGQAMEVALDLNIPCHQGVYVSVPGPNLETVAEYKYLRVIGADAVGMSTVHENLVARHMELPVFAVSVITDLGVPGKIKKISIEEVIAAAKVAEPRMTALIKELIARQ
ncbi:MAG: purine-nucleoside phosphorylase [Cyclobacteriaceae bacterium]|nr:purine-nucleoside phosphorylase [Cyclobacteriaceae bacterium]